MQVGYGMSSREEILLKQLHAQRKADDLAVGRELAHLGADDNTSKDLTSDKKVQAVDKSYESNVETQKEDVVELSGSPKGINAFPEFQVYSYKDGIVRSAEDFTLKRRHLGKEDELSEDSMPTKQGVQSTLLIAQPMPIQRNENSHRLQYDDAQALYEQSLGKPEDLLDQTTIKAQAEEKQEEEYQTQIEQVVNESLQLDPSKEAVDLNANLKDPVVAQQVQEQVLVQVAAPKVNGPNGPSASGEVQSVAITVTKENKSKDPTDFSTFIKTRQTSVAEGQLLAELGTMSRLNAQAMRKANIDEIKTEDSYENRRFFEMVHEQRRLIGSKISSMRNIGIFMASRDKNKLVDGTDNKFEIDVQTQFTTSWTEIMVNPALTDKTGSKESTGGQDPNQIIQRPVHTFDISIGFNKDLESANHNKVVAKNEVNILDNRSFSKDVVVSKVYKAQQEEQQVKLSPQPFFAPKPKAVSSFYEQKEASKANQMPEPFIQQGPEVMTQYELQTDPSFFKAGMSKTAAAAMEYSAMSLKSTYQQQKYFEPDKPTPNIEVPRKAASNDNVMRIMPVEKLVDTPKLAVQNKQAQAAVMVQANVRQQAKAQSTEARRKTKPVVKTTNKRADVQINVTQKKRSQASKTQKAMVAYQSTQPARKTVNNKAHTELTVKAADKRNASRVVDKQNTKNTAVSFIKQQVKTEFKSITFKKVNQMTTKGKSDMYKIPHMSSMAGGVRVRPLNVNIRPQMNNSIQSKSLSSQANSTD